MKRLVGAVLLDCAFNTGRFLGALIAGMERSLR